MNTQGALKQYRMLNLQAGTEGASPHRLIQMLMEGALEKIGMAKNHMNVGEVADKGKYISWAITIIDGLRASLDYETGGEIAANLGGLYDYMERRLVEANYYNDPAALDEVAGLLSEIKDAWEAIPEEAKAVKPSVEEG